MCVKEGFVLSSFFNFDLNFFQNLIFSFDANFGLSRKKSSGKSPGEAFHTGRYFLDQTEVDDFVQNYVCLTKKGDGVSYLEFTFVWDLKAIYYLRSHMWSG